MTRPLPLYRRSLGESWRSLIGWSLGFLAALLLYVPLFSSIGGNPDMQALLDSLPPAMISALGYGAIATGAGYVSATFYGLMGFALSTIAAVAWSSAAIAGDEELGSLELTLAHGVTRTQVVLERSAAIITKLVWLNVLSVLVIFAPTTARVSASSSVTSSPSVPPSSESACSSPWWASPREH